MRIILAGQKWFGAEVFRELRKHKEISIVSVCSPVGSKREDKLTAQANLWRVPLIASGTLSSATIPEKIDLIVAAHSHDFIGEKTRLRATHGGIGYHPSLLPLHRGRDAVRWTIRMGDNVAGGSVYRLSNYMDAGNIVDQRHVFVPPGETAQGLWRNALGPLGVELLVKSTLRYAQEGFINGTPQDEAIATWEPSIDRPPAYRPDLIMLPFYG